MNATHIHLLLNHVSILGTIFSVILFFAGIFRNNETIRQIALVGFVVSALAAIPVFLTGEDAEHAVKNLPGTVKATIEEHEESADVAFWLIELLGAAALSSLVFGRKKFLSTTVYSGLFMLLSFAAVGTISYAGYLGGKIRHTEISSTAAVQGPNQTEEDGERGGSEKD